MRPRLTERLLNKIKNVRGESLSETLISVLIIVLAMLMLAGSIVSASKVNRQVKDANTAFNTETDGSVTAADGTAQISTTSSGSGTVTITPTVVPVQVYTTGDDNKYVYYEFTPTPTPEVSVTP